MNRIRIGVLGPANIALRRTIPAIIKSEKCEFAGVAVASYGERELGIAAKYKLNKDDPSDISRKKAENIVKTYGGIIYDSYMAMIKSEDVDAIYIALPPALHSTWGELALKNNKHVFMEKPFTVSMNSTGVLVELAKERNLAIAENFAFIYHKQLEEIKAIIESGRIGDIRLIRSNFGFPHRDKDDFRYNKDLGGGALLDCGCYTIKLAQMLLGTDVKIEYSRLYSSKDESVDIYGVIEAVNDKGVPAQLSFSMDQQYCCELEVWGSKGCISSPRIYTAPDELSVDIRINTGVDTNVISVPAEDQFKKSVDSFADMINNPICRNNSYEEIINQGRLLERCMSIV